MGWYTHHKRTRNPAVFYSLTAPCMWLILGRLICRLLASPHFTLNFSLFCISVSFAASQTFIVRHNISTWLQRKDTITFLYLSYYTWKIMLSLSCTMNVSWKSICIQSHLNNIGFLLCFVHMSRCKRMKETRLTERFILLTSSCVNDM